MIVSWNWLQQYISLEGLTHEEVALRLAMSGLNHEGTEGIGKDFAIDLEVTSNRPDCLGHIGVARELAVLYERELTKPDPQPATGSASINDLTSVTIDCPELCNRYTARIIQGAKVGPSPDWLAERLTTLGIAVINNVVDITNYVLFECGQPLHAFDFAKLNGGKIVVRESQPGEEFVAINHKTYELEAGTCVIADADRAVALGGVMGGADTEVSDSTTDILIEAADFAPLSIRTTARKHALHSPSSFRFERGVDAEAVDWASRRCCELILELAGGELAEGVIDIGTSANNNEPVVLRLSQLERILGIKVPTVDVRRIFSALGCEEQSASDGKIQVLAPSWRRDLPREIDLVEEVARVYGYDKIPEDVGVPMAPSHKRDKDRIEDIVRSTLTAAGFDEAMTASVVPEKWSQAFSPWTDKEAIQSSTPMLKGADRLRRSLVPSLLDVCKTNEALSNSDVHLFETAMVYLPTDSGLPQQTWSLVIASGHDYVTVKGIVEALIGASHTTAKLEVKPTSQTLLDPAKSAQLSLNGDLFGFIGEVTPKGLKQFGMRSAVTVVELNLELLQSVAQLIPQHTPQSAFPAMSRDLNLIVDEAVRWSDLAGIVHSSGGDHLEGLQYSETYRDTKKDGDGKKRLLFSISLRSQDRTLTGEEADAIRDGVVAACNKELGAVLLG